MQVFQKVLKTDLMNTFIGADLDTVTDVFLDRDQLNTVFESFVVAEKTDQIDHSSLIRVGLRPVYLQTGEQIAYVQVKKLIDLAKAAINSGAKLYPFALDCDPTDPYLSMTSSIMSYNPLFKQHGLAYSRAKLGFIKAAPATKKKIPASALGDFRFAFISWASAEVTKKFGPTISFSTVSNVERDSACAILKAMGHDIKNVLVDGFGPNRKYGVEAYVKLKVTELDLSTDQAKELTTQIKEWWAGLNK